MDLCPTPTLQPSPGQELPWSSGCSFSGPSGASCLLGASARVSTLLATTAQSRVLLPWTDLSWPPGTGPGRLGLRRPAGVCSRCHEQWRGAHKCPCLRRGNRTACAGCSSDLCCPRSEALTGVWGTRRHCPTVLTPMGSLGRARVEAMWAWGRIGKPR